MFGERAQVIARLEAGIAALVANEITRRAAKGRHVARVTLCRLEKPGFGPGFSMSALPGSVLPG